MCGIVGYIGKEPIETHRVVEACNALHHRGPDGKGIYENKFNENFITFGHRRLSIIDLNKRSDQPFIFRDNVLIFNGEIYNYLEIREELKNLGHIFITDGDTEVLSHALYEWEEEAFKKLEGMWSLAWFNKKKGEVILSRDRFGEKPMYLWNISGKIFFASEIKALKKIVGMHPTINENQIYRYLTNGYKSIYKKKETFFKEIVELDKSSFLKIKKDFSVVKKKYWSTDYVQNHNLSYKNSVENVREILINSVKQKIRSDVPIAFCMSGGIDSNCLISIAKKIFKYDVHGFTIKNKDERYTEEKLVDKSKDYLGIKHTYVDTNQENFLENLTKQINSHDCPISTISYYLHSQLLEAMSKKGFKVSISGTGADEIFTGYYDHHLFYLSSLEQNKNFFKESYDNWKSYISGKVRNPFLKDYQKFISHKDKRNHIYLNNDIFEKYLIKDWSENFTENKFSTDELRNRMANEMFHESVPVILHEDDMNAMYYSIENRSPFLDKDLYEFGNKIPSKYLIKDGFSKSVLRDAMQGIVCDEVLKTRQKKGFNASLKELVDFNDSKTKQRLLDKSKIFEIVKQSEIEKLIKSKELQNSFSKYLFNFINSKIFVENFTN